MNTNSLLQRVSKTSSLLVMSLLVIASFVLARTPGLVHAAACAAGSYGTDTMSVSVQSTTTYSIWVEMYTGTASDNAIDLQVDSNTCYDVGGKSLPTDTWVWVNTENGASTTMSQSFTQATHSLELIGTEPGVEVNQILLLANSGCTPSGNGTNCTTGQATPTPTATATAKPTTTPTPTKSATPTPTKSGNPTPTPGPTSTPAPTGTGTGAQGGTTSSSSSNGFTGTITTNPTAITPITYSNPSESNSNAAPDINATPTAVQISSPTTVDPTYVRGQTIQEVQYYLNKKEIYTATKAPYTYTLNTNDLQNGKYILASKTIYTSGTVTPAAVTVIVKHSFFKNFYIFLVNNIVTILIILIILALLIWQGMVHQTYLRNQWNKYFHPGDINGTPTGSGGGDTRPTGILAMILNLVHKPSGLGSAPKNAFPTATPATTTPNVANGSVSPQMIYPHGHPDAPKDASPSQAPPIKPA